jgi:hypothetical protein
MIYRATLLAYLTANESQSKHFTPTATLYDTSGKLREVCYGKAGDHEDGDPRISTLWQGTVVAHVISLPVFARFSKGVLI